MKNIERLGLIQQLEKIYDCEDINLVKKAIKFNDSFEFTSENNIQDNLELATLTSEINLSPSIIITSMLYFRFATVEDSHESIKNGFGEHLFILLKRVKDIDIYLSELSDSYEFNLNRVLLIATYDIRAIIICIAKIRFSLKKIATFQRKEKKRLMEQIENFFLPLCAELNLSELVIEFENIFFSDRQTFVKNYFKDKIVLDEMESSKYLDAFMVPIVEELNHEGVIYDFEKKIKSLVELYKDIENENISINEMFDRLSIKIFIYPRPEPSGKRQIFDILSLITDYYKPKPDRIRDWVTIPRDDGYEGLHFTVMGQEGLWVHIEIQTVGKRNQFELKTKVLYHMNFSTEFNESENINILNYFKIKVLENELLEFRKKKTINNINEYIDLIFNLNKLKGSNSLRRILFRGQDIDEPLLPKIARFKIKNLRIIEQKIFSDFKRLSILSTNKQNIENNLDWLALAQHNGLPTRLLDWSENPLIALWFAFNKKINSAEDKYRYIYCFIIDEDFSINNADNPFTISKTKSFMPNHLSNRITAQKGCFSIHELIDNKFLPLDTNDEYKERILKYQIPANLRNEILLELDSLGINAFSAFPDLEGLSKFLQWNVLE